MAEITITLGDHKVKTTMQSIAISGDNLAVAPAPLHSDVSVNPRVFLISKFSKDDQKKMESFLQFIADKYSASFGTPHDVQINPAGPVPSFNHGPRSGGMPSLPPSQTR